MALLPRGTVVRVDFDPTVGHEQSGERPAIIISDETLTSDIRYYLLGVIPLTGHTLKGPLYPSLQPDGRNGLKMVSYALVDQIRSVDPARIVSHAGPINQQALFAVETSLRKFLRLR